MKKAEWLMAILFIGMGLTCMTISAVSFQNTPLIPISGVIKIVVCLLFIVLLTFCLVRFYKIRKKRLNKKTSE